MLSARLPESGSLHAWDHAFSMLIMLSCVVMRTHRSQEVLQPALLEAHTERCEKNDRSSNEHPYGLIKKSSGFGFCTPCVSNIYKRMQKKPRTKQVNS
jgi:hypothetical protein